MKQENAQGQINKVEAPYWERDFVGKEIKQIAVPLSRFGVDFDSVRKIEIPESPLKLTDTQVAKMLGGIDIYDENLKKIDLSTNQGVINAMAVEHAKSLVVLEAGFDKKFESRVSKFMNKMMGSAKKFLALDEEPNPNRRKFIKQAAPVAFLALLATACSPVVAGVGPVVAADGQPISTPTSKEALPTSTAPATATSRPTEIPTKKLDPGFETPVIIDGVKLLFTSVEISGDTTKMDAITLRPKAGESVLVLTVKWDGNMAALLMDKEVHKPANFYIDDGTGITIPPANFSGDPKKTVMKWGFYVKTGAESYTLNNKVGAPWAVDLTHKIVKKIPTQTSTAAP